jgi:hypothetical protein
MSLNNLTAYDASYVALAEALDVRLLTADPRIARAPGLACQIDVIGLNRGTGRRSSMRHGRRRLPSSN